MSGRHGHQLIDAVIVFTNIQKLNPGSVSELPKTEKQVRPLVSLTSVQTTVCSSAAGIALWLAVKETRVSWGCG
jgi:hypothetical protein